MKITIFSESSNDEAAIRILVEGILGEEIEEIPRPFQLKSRGVYSLLEFSSKAIISAFYQTESDAIVIVCDSNDKPVHKPEHEEKENEDSRKCRFCLLKRKVAETLDSLTPQPHRQMIKVAIGVAVPSIEAWFMCGKKLDVSEERWIGKLNGEKVGYDAVSLKQKIYGEKPFRRKKIEIAISEAERLIQNLELLEEKFSEGFGNLAKEIKLWK